MPSGERVLWWVGLALLYIMLGVAWMRILALRRAIARLGKTLADHAQPRSAPPADPEPEQRPPNPNTGLVPLVLPAILYDPMESDIAAALVKSVGDVATALVKALAGVPHEILKPLCKRVTFHVSPEDQAEELFGYYTDVGGKEQIVICAPACQRAAERGEPLDQVVRNVCYHEIGHATGLDHDMLKQYGL